MNHEIRSLLNNQDSMESKHGFFPYHSHTTPIRIPKDMGIVWETYHKRVPLLGVPENTIDLYLWMYYPSVFADLRKSYLWSWWDLRWVIFCRKARVFSGRYEWYTRLQWLVDDDLVGFTQKKYFQKKLRWTTRISGFDGFLGWFFF